MNWRIIILIPACALATVACEGPSTAPTAPTARVPVELRVTAGTYQTLTHIGQSVTMPGTGSVRDIRFNWYDAEGPVAFGNLCILDQEFPGVPWDLGPAQPGFVACAQRTTDTEYIFPPDMALAGGKRYWFYANQRDVVMVDIQDGTYPGGDLYRAIGVTFLFHRWAIGTFGPARVGYGDANFRLQGIARGSGRQADLKVRLYDRRAGGSSDPPAPVD